MEGFSYSKPGLGTYAETDVHTFALEARDWEHGTGSQPWDPVVIIQETLGGRRGGTWTHAYLYGFCQIEKQIPLNSCPLGFWYTDEITQKYNGQACVWLCESMCTWDMLTL